MSPFGGSENAYAPARPAKGVGRIQPGRRGWIATALSPAVAGRVGGWLYREERADGGQRVRACAAQTLWLLTISCSGDGSPGTYLTARRVAEAQRRGLCATRFVSSAFLRVCDIKVGFEEFPFFVL
jgi:hypothetical protein